MSYMKTNFGLMNLVNLMKKTEANYMKTKIISLDHRELSTILAALRYWSRFGDDGDPEFDIATDGGNIEALGDDEIDQLCKRINT